MKRQPCDAWITGARKCSRHARWQQANPDGTLSEKVFCKQHGPRNERSFGPYEFTKWIELMTGKEWIARCEAGSEYHKIIGFHSWAYFTQQPLSTAPEHWVRGLYVTD